ncbi:flagellar basal-body rod protein FlgG [Alicyclobacillus contaminans]|uniref:flagellar hook-basal body protein n=1 Tax=Alicyclobacillus contaminans TaxID=392016 RepID=UPI000419834F|nr:flagellar hook-basal body protein [Alicyclobacillus contaminans]GMA50989.1 flagellar basal-body rod protein FlgG [Alicyclobacillus contaminans]
MQSLWTGLSALQASQQWLNRVGDNLANEDTVGYSADEGSFADTFTALLNQSAPVNAAAGRMTPPNWRGGTGVMAVSEEKDFSQLPLQRTDNPMDLAIQGDGFFAVQGANGQLLLTKAGDFTWSETANGQFELATQAGQPVLDTAGRPITYSGTSQPTLGVGPNGDVTINGRSTGQRLALVTVPLPGQHLTPVDGNAYVVNPGVAVTVANRGNTNTGGQIEQGMLAMSNVDLTQQMTDMIAAQRMFDLNAESVQMTNRMMGDANQIRR